MIYAIPLHYRVSSSNSYVSITRLHRAFQSVIKKHIVLRTALYTNVNGAVMQQCLDSNINDDTAERFGFSIMNHDDNTDRSIDEIITDTMKHSHLFDLAKGHVIHCHILRQYRENNDVSSESLDLLNKDDFCLLYTSDAADEEDS